MRSVQFSSVTSSVQNGERGEQAALTEGKSKADAQVCGGEAHAQAERPKTVRGAATLLTCSKDNVEKAAKKAKKEEQAVAKREVCVDTVDTFNIKGTSIFVPLPEPQHGPRTAISCPGRHQLYQL